MKEDNVSNNFWPCEIVAMRHFFSKGNELRTVEARARYPVPTHDYPLTELGRQQGAYMREWASKNLEPYDVYYVSTFKRAIETMELVFPRARYVMNPMINEIDRGIYHVLTGEELAKELPFEVTRAEKNGKYYTRPIGGENYLDLHLRIGEFVQRLQRDCAGKRVCIVSHSHWIVGLQAYLWNWTPDEQMAVLKEELPPNGSMTTFEGIRGGGWIGHLTRGPYRYLVPRAVGLDPCGKVPELREPPPPPLESAEPAREAKERAERAARESLPGLQDR